MYFPLCLTILLLYSPSYVISQPLFDFPMANLSTSWINSVSLNHSIWFRDHSISRLILYRGVDGPSYACGFFCNGNCETYLFSVFIIPTDGEYITGFPQVVWSANRNNLVKINSTLELTEGGNLVLTDIDGTLVWSTGTSGMSVAGLNLTHLGNLVLFNVNGSIVWQSFDHPTDVLLPGQHLVLGENLTASVSDTNWTQGMLSLSITSDGIEASVDIDPPQIYYSGEIWNGTAGFAIFQNGSIGFYTNSVDPRNLYLSVIVPQANSAQLLKLQPDGHVRVFEWNGDTGWTEVADILTRYIDVCDYPTVCGEFGICSNGQCSCPLSNLSSGSFRQIDYRQPNVGCSEIVPLTCDINSNHTFLHMEGVAYFNFYADISGVDVNSCKEACLRNCSCRAAIFQYGSNSSGDCYLPSQIFSMKNNVQGRTDYNSSVSLKIQISPGIPRRDSSRPLGAILGSITIISSGIIIIAIVVIIYRKKKNARKKKSVEEVEEDHLDIVAGMPTRFSYEELVAATDNFKQKLGHGGFGSVFQGLLKDSTQIAVKCLNDIGHIKKSFLAEVETIGSIHHVNLVRLVGFCAEKSHRLLVYEYMCNGSLDTWIFKNSHQESMLDWLLRRKIILDVAKGLAYLHEECRQKIIHLDIKPQNILLDENCNAKLADFGLSKLIDRDQSQVVTTMRGTPGYLAPEWLSAVITEKVDVYSFGIVTLEIICGRRNFEQSRPEEERHLLSLFMKKAEEGQWMDIIDKTISPGVTEAVEMMEIAAWCLQSDYTKRPSMSTVVKVLEGAIDVRKDLDFNLFNPHNFVHQIQEFGFEDGTPLLPSVLSGPR